MMKVYLVTFLTMSFFANPMEKIQEGELSEYVPYYCIEENGCVKKVNVSSDMQLFQYVKWLESLFPNEILAIIAQYILKECDGLTPFILWRMPLNSSIINKRNSYDQKEAHFSSFSKGGDRVAVFSGSSKIIIYERARGKPLIQFCHIISSTSSYDSVGMVFNKNGDHLLLGNPLRASAKIVDVATGCKIKKFKPSNYKTQLDEAFAMVDDEERLAAFKVCDRRRRICSAQYFKDEDEVIAICTDNNVRRWSFETEECLQEVSLQGEYEYLVMANISGKGDKVVSVHKDGTLLVWSAFSGMVLSKFDTQKERVVSCRIDSNGNKVLVAYHANVGRIWSLEASEVLHELVGHKQPLTLAEFNRQGDKVATSSYDKSVRIWSVETGSCLRVLQLLPVRMDDHVIQSVCFNYAGDFVAASRRNGEVVVWEMGLLESGWKCLSLEQVFLLQVIYEVLVLRKLMMFRNRSNKQVVSNDGKLLLVRDILFDFSQYTSLTEHEDISVDVESVYDNLPQQIKAVLNQFVKRAGWRCIVC